MRVSNCKVSFIRFRLLGLKFLPIQLEFTQWNEKKLKSHKNSNVMFCLRIFLFFVYVNMSSRIENENWMERKTEVWEEVTEREEEMKKRKCSWSLFWINQKLRAEKCDQIMVKEFELFVWIESIRRKNVNENAFNKKSGKK